MPDDPKDPRDHRKSPPPVPKIPNRAITERGGGGGSGDHDRSRRHATPPQGWPASKEAWNEEITGNYEGEELRAARARRGTNERISRLEDKHDQLDAKVDRIDVAVADMGGQFKVIPRLVEAMENATTALHQREHVTFTAKVDVDKAEALGDIKVKEAQAISDVKVRQAKWQLLIKIAAVAGAIGTTVSTLIAARGC